MNNKKLLTTINVLVFLTSVTLLLINYFNINNPQLSSSNRQPQQINKFVNQETNFISNDTEYQKLNWSTYTNKNFGVSFEYPTNYMSVTQMTGNSPVTIREEKDTVRVMSRSGLSYIFEIQKMNLDKALESINQDKNIGNVFKTKFRNKDTYFVNTKVDMQVPSNLYYIILNDSDVIRVSYSKALPIRMGIQMIESDGGKTDRAIQSENDYDTIIGPVIDRIINTIEFTN